MTVYTEDELKRLSRAELLKIVCWLNEAYEGPGIDTRGKRRDVLIEDILEAQEEKGAHS